MKPNEIKLRLIKIDGINVFFGKGIYDTETTLCTEKKGFLFKGNKSIYNVTSGHIKRSKKGRALCIIDLATHQSINPHTKNKDIKTINEIQYVTQKANWEAHLKRLKMSVWAQLILIFCGMGIFFLITTIVRNLGIMF